MKKLSLTFLLPLLIYSGLFSQDFIWQAGIFSFFDNVEFGNSSVKIPQTMAGIRISPEIGFKWDSVHRITGGLNLMHEFGSGEAVDNISPTAYYQYRGGNYTFLMGAFPRAAAVENYPRMFFQDSLSYYRPNINGIYFQYGKDQKYAGIWLDWTGRQSEMVREAFFVGLKGNYNKGIFYARHFSYMFHFASRKNPVISEALHDNLLFRTSLGANLSDMSSFDVLDINAGWVAGLERARADNTGWIPMHGFQAEVRAEYRFAGIFDSFYAGEGLMHFYADHQNELYWGDPAYRVRTYNRTDIYIRFFRKQNVDLELTWSLHFLENKVYNEQMLKLRIDLKSSRKGQVT